MFTLDADGKRVYTLKKVVNGEVTKSAHPARFSPDDRYSRYISHHELYLKRQKMEGRRERENRERGTRIGPSSPELQAPRYDQKEIWAFDHTAEYASTTFPCYIPKRSR